jgi:hypothetical protein
MSFSSDIAYDFYNPWCAAGITTSDGAYFPLWTGVGGTGQLWSDIGHQDVEGLTGFPFLSSIEVELNLGMAPTITAVFTPDLLSFRRFIDSTLVEWATSVLSVQFGYGSVGSPVFQGIILQPTVALGANPVVTLHCAGTGAQTLMDQTGGQVYTGTVQNILFEIIQGNGSNPQAIVIDDSRVFASNNTALIAAYSQTTISEAQSYQSYWTLIWKLLREIRCYSLSIGAQKGPPGSPSAPDIIQIVPADDFQKDPPKKWLRFYDFPDGQVGNAVDQPPFEKGGPNTQGCIPILSVSSPSNQHFANATARGLALSGVNSKSGASVHNLVTDPNLTPNGAQPSTIVPAVVTAVFDRVIAMAPDSAHPGLNPNTYDGGGYSSADPNNPQGVTKARADYLSWVPAASGVQLKVVTPGVPDLLPGTNVMVAGISARYDSMYSIQDMVFKLDNSGFTTEFSLLAGSYPKSSILAAEARGDLVVETGDANATEISNTLDLFASDQVVPNTAAMPSDNAIVVTPSSVGVIDGPLS